MISIYIFLLCLVAVANGKSVHGDHLNPDNDGLLDFDLNIKHDKHGLKFDIEAIDDEELNSIESNEAIDYYHKYSTPGLSVTIDETAPGAWNYEGEHEWNEKFPACGGIRQSPIDIDTNEVRHLRKPKCLNWSNYKNNQRFLTLKNPGHTIEASCTWDSGEFPTLEGGILTGSYRFAALHWHWGFEHNEGSDHTVDSKSAPLEMHLVHYNTKFPSLSAAIASQESEALTVVGILFEINTSPNPGMFTLVDAMLKAKTNGTQNRNLPLGNLGLNFADNYYTYLGSLTTPPCYEIVRWIVLKERLHISNQQLEVFRNVLTNDKQLYNNFRQVQPINDRIVTDVSNCI